MAIVLFVGAQIVPATTTGEVATFFEAFIMGLVPIVLHFTMWSDWMHTKISNDGLKINYKLYQIIGLVVVLLNLMIVTTAYFQGYYGLI